MKIKARFFALYRELAGKGLDEFEVNGPVTAGAFREEVVRRYPALEAYFASVAMAVNAEYAAAETGLKDGDEVAFFPPLSGGCYCESACNEASPRGRTQPIAARCACRQAGKPVVPAVAGLLRHRSLANGFLAMTAS